jgi:hypothetical protein
MKNFTMFLYCFSLLTFFLKSSCLAESGLMDKTPEIVSESTYRIASDESPEIYESLCFFNAKYKAVTTGAKYLNHIGMVKDYGESRKEIYCLVAENLTPSIIEKKESKDTNAYYMKIKAKLDLSDFTKAEIRNNEIEEQEGHFSWQEEMEQTVYEAIRPGEEISRAYRYLRKKEWRMAIIYLNHLQKKYPNWHEIYFAKAIGYYAENKPKAMVNALNSACFLGNNEACEDLRGFSEDHETIELK